MSGTTCAGTAARPPRDHAGTRWLLTLGVLSLTLVGLALGAPLALAQEPVGLAAAVAHAPEAPTSVWLRLQSLAGIPVMLGLAWLLSNNRRAVPWRVIAWGMALQFGFALLILKTTAGLWLFGQLNTGVTALLGYSTAGARFLFGSLVDHVVPVGTPNPGDPFGPLVPLLADGGAPMLVGTGAFFAFNVLPTIIFFSALMAVLYHLGVMQLAVRGMGWVMARTLGTSGAESLSTAANIFLGQTEAPLVVKPYLQGMTMSELNAVMTGGFATVAGGVLAAYVGMLSGVFPDIAGHLIAASVMAAPATLVVAKIMWPDDGVPATRGSMPPDAPTTDVNVVDAAARGATEGLTLALNVAAMLLAFIALAALVNGLLGAASRMAGLPTPVTLEGMLGVLFWPLAFAMGVPASECAVVGELLGVKTILNEFVAYLQLAQVAEGLSRRSMIIATYALCGFANLGSIGIQLGGIGAIAPGRRGDLARLGVRAMIAGTLATFLTANVAGTLLS